MRRAAALPSSLVLRLVSKTFREVCEELWLVEALDAKLAILTSVFSRLKSWLKPRADLLAYSKSLLTSLD